MEEKPTWLEIHYESGKVAVMEWDEYDHFIGVLENTPLDEHEIVSIIEVEAWISPCTGEVDTSEAPSWVKVWWSRDKNYLEGMR